jgi:hypothetical protein
VGGVEKERDRDRCLAKIDMLIGNLERARTGVAGKSMQDINKGN